MNAQKNERRKWNSYLLTQNLSNFLGFEHKCFSLFARVLQIFFSCCCAAHEFTFCVVVVVADIRTKHSVENEKQANHIGQVNLDQLFLRDEMRIHT